jgi:uncharacterized protein (DUF488 family)
MAMTLPIHTIGHSTRTIEEFVDILRSGGVQWLVDVRTVPRSRTNPQYNADLMPDSLGSWQIGYDRIAELGGLRGRSLDIDPSVNGYWENQSFHNYADYALSDSFAEGLDRLERLAEGRRVAVMCSEAVWWRCHRRIIADYLLLHGREVLHLMGRGRIEPARMTAAARVQDRRLVYPALAP